MNHLHYFSSKTQEDYELANTICSTCGTPHPGDEGWWEIAGQPTCTACTMIAEEVAEATGEPLVLGQINTLSQQMVLEAWKAANVNAH